jgi:hypothetical protein
VRKKEDIPREKLRPFDPFRRSSLILRYSPHGSTHQSMVDADAAGSRQFSLQPLADADASGSR